MNRKQTAVILVVFVAIVGAAAFYIYQPTTPAVQDEFSTIDDWLSELDDFLNFENQDFDYDLGEISGDWG